MILEQLKSHVGNKPYCSNGRIRTPEETETSTRLDNLVVLFDNGGREVLLEF